MDSLHFDRRRRRVIIRGSVCPVRSCESTVVSHVITSGSELGSTNPPNGPQNSGLVGSSTTWKISARPPRESESMQVATSTPNV